MIKKILDFFKKLLGQKDKGFTLVELLIVIALIGILAGAVVATLNPIEQINKANDAKAANDAAEVVNALERYYASQNKYPWNMIDSTIVVDDPYGVVSNKIGFGVCGAANVVNSLTNCDSNTEGSLISTDELKGSFSTKSYFDTTATELELMYLFKFGSDGTYPNAIYVCYVPNAKVNRTSANRLWILTIDGTTKQPTNLARAPTDPSDANYSTYFNGDGSPKSTYSDLGSSLLKCMPE